MRAVDRYITYYKVIDDEYIDTIVFDRMKKKMSLQRNVVEMALGSMDINDNYYMEIALPDYIFELVASSIENVILNNYKFENLQVFHLSAYSKGRLLELVIEAKNKIYFTSYANGRGESASGIAVDYEIIGVIIKQLEFLNYKNITNCLKEGII